MLTNIDLAMQCMRKVDGILDQAMQMGFEGDDLSQANVIIPKADFEAIANSWWIINSVQSSGASQYDSHSIQKAVENSAAGLYYGANFGFMV